MGVRVATSTSSRSSGAPDSPSGSTVASASALLDPGLGFLFNYVGAGVSVGSEEATSPLKIPQEDRSSRMKNQPRR